MIVTKLPKKECMEKRLSENFVILNFSEKSANFFLRSFFFTVVHSMHCMIISPRLGGQKSSSESNVNSPSQKNVSKFQLRTTTEENKKKKKEKIERSFSLLVGRSFLACCVTFPISLELSTRLWSDQRIYSFGINWQMLLEKSFRVVGIKER
jgi:hypothetical protein